MLNIRWNITQKFDPTLKTSTYRQVRKILMFSAQKKNVHAVFKRYRPRTFAHMFYMYVHPET